MDRTQVWAVWCFCWLLKMKTATFLCIVQFRVSESNYFWYLRVIHAKNHMFWISTTLPFDKNPDFQFQMVQLLSMKEPPSNLPEDAWDFRLLPQSHTVLCVRVCNTHCDIVITAEPHSMKKNIMKLIKRANYLPLFLYSNISFMLSQYERSSHSLIRFKHWHNVFDYVMFPIIVKYQFAAFLARWLSINSIILLTSSLHFKRVPATHCHTRAHNHSSNTTAN